MPGDSWPCGAGLGHVGLGRWGDLLQSLCMDLGKVQGVLFWSPPTWLEASVPSEMKGEGQEATSPSTPDPAGLMAGVGGSP